jgi:two-component system, response regulator YesN
MRGVLIVDDEELSRFSVRKLLARSFPAVPVLGEAENGRLAVELALSLEPDIILMDIKIPVLNGLDAAAAILVSLPATRIIILSAYDSFGFAQRAVNLGLAGYILKPVREEEFTAVFSSALDRAQGVGEGDEPEADGRGEDPNPTDATAYPYEAEEDFYRVLELGRPPEIQAAGKAFVAKIGEAAGNLPELKDYCLEFSVALRRKIKSLGFVFGASEAGGIVLKGPPGRDLIRSPSEALSAVDADALLLRLEDDLEVLLGEIAVARFADPRAKIDEAIASCPWQDLSLENVAERLGLSPPYLSRIFKDIYGIRFLEHVTARKIDAAKDILRSERITVEELCRRLGWSDVSYFSRLFRDRTGSTPKAWGRAFSDSLRKRREEGERES